MRALLQDRLLALVTSTPELATLRRQLERDVEAGRITAPRAVDTLIARLGPSAIA